MSTSRDRTFMSGIVSFTRRSVQVDLRLDRGERRLHVPALFLFIYFLFFKISDIPAHLCSDLFICCTVQYNIQCIGGGRGNPLTSGKILWPDSKFNSLLIVIIARHPPAMLWLGGTPNTA